LKQKNKHGVFIPTPVTIGPTFDHGYITGFILGDGCATKGSYLVHGKKTPNYKVLVGTTVKQTAEHFRDKMQATFPQLSPYFRETTHKYKDGRIPYFEVWVSSKEFWGFIRPLKLPDFAWRFPGELGSEDFKRGFLQGIFDAEGCIYQNHGKRGFPSYDTLYWRIEIGQKQRGNLDQICTLLREFNISGVISPENNSHMWKLTIAKRDQVLLFCKEVSFALPKKEERAANALKELSVPKCNPVPLERRKQISKIALMARWHPKE